LLLGSSVHTTENRECVPSMLESVAHGSFIEYQLMMLSLAGGMCVSMFLVEMVIDQFHVLPILFPSMFSIRERRYYAYGVDVTDGSCGEKIREGAKMVVRITLGVTLSYLWQSCIMEAIQSFGSEFPELQCSQGYDCFASRFHFSTLYKQDFTPIDCHSPPVLFATQTVVTCVRLIPLNATSFLMHLGVSYAISQLTFKTYEVSVWIAGEARYVRRLLTALVVLTLVGLVATYFAGFLVLFVNSWLSFVMCLAVPIFLHTVRTTGSVLHRARCLEEAQHREILKEQINKAFANIEDAFLISAPLIAQDDLQSSKQVEHSRTTRSLHTMRSFVGRVKSTISRTRLNSDSGDELSGPSQGCSGIFPSESNDDLNTSERHCVGNSVDPLGCSDRCAAREAVDV